MEKLGKTNPKGARYINKCRLAFYWKTETPFLLDKKSNSRTSPKNGKIRKD